MSRQRRSNTVHGRHLPFSRALPAAGLVLAIVVGAAGPASAASAPSTTNVSAGPGGITLSSTAVPAGVDSFHFTTTDPKGADITVFALKGGATVGQVMHDIGQSMSHNSKVAGPAIAKVASEIEAYGGAELGTPGQAVNVAMSLPGGTYHVLDAVTMKASTLTVSGGQPSTALPPTAASVTYVGDRFVTGAALPARGSISVANNSSDLHFMQLWPVKPGTTDSQVQAAFQAEAHGQSGAPS
ncbi:MAG: hypothetical protein ACRD0H_20830, partial [Actinomycetes bacterium]